MFVYTLYFGEGEKLLPSLKTDDCGSKIRDMLETRMRGRSYADRPATLSPRVTRGGGEGEELR